MEAEARPSSEGSKRKRRLPAGMSDYQAAWITEEELQDTQDSDSDEEEEMAERQGGDAEPSFGEMGMDGAASMTDLDEEDDQTDDLQVHHHRVHLYSLNAGNVCIHSCQDKQAWKDYCFEL